MNLEDWNKHIEYSKEVSRLFERTKKLKDNKPIGFRKNENDFAKTLAIVVRNQMENFHCKHLSDAQMKELNPIIRNAIYTALVQLIENRDAMVAYAQLYIPPYWEDCELLDL